MYYVKHKTKGEKTMKKSIVVKSGDSVVIQKGAILVIANQSLSIANMEVMDANGNKVKIMALVPAGEV